MASYVLTYLLWLFGGFCGLHHIYLGRTSHAFLYAATFGCLGFGWLHDLWRIPQYVRQANSEPHYIEDMKVRARNRPNTSLARATTMFFVGSVFSRVALAPVGWLEPLPSLLSPLASAYLGSLSPLFTPPAAASAPGAFPAGPIPLWWPLLTSLVSALGAGVGVLTVGSVGGQRTVNRYYVLLAAVVGSVVDAVVVAMGGSDASDLSSEMQALRLIFPIVVWARSCEWVPTILHRHAVAALASNSVPAAAALSPSINSSDSGSSNSDASGVTAAAAGGAQSLNAPLLSASSSGASDDDNVSSSSSSALDGGGSAGQRRCDFPRRLFTVILSVTAFWGMCGLYVYHYVPIPTDSDTQYAAASAEYAQSNAPGAGGSAAPEYYNHDNAQQQQKQQHQQQKAKTTPPQPDDKDEEFYDYFGFDYNTRNARTAPMRVKDVLIRIRRSRFWSDAATYIPQILYTVHRDGFGRAWDDLVGTMDLNGGEWAFNVLGLEEASATRRSARKRRGELALKWHPDKNPAERKKECEEKINEINEAYKIVEEVLSKREASGAGAAAGADAGAAGAGRASRRNKDEL